MKQKRLGIKESRVFVMPEGFHLLVPEHRQRSTRASRFQEHPSELIRKEVSKLDPVSLPLVFRYAFESGRKNMEKWRLLLLCRMPYPRLP